MKRLLRILKRTVIALVALAIAFVVLAAIMYRQPIYNRFVDFPAEAAAWDTLRSQRIAPENPTPWQEYRGSLHAHSFLSHDSVVQFDHILESAKQADIDFIMMTDHCAMGRADYSRGWKGDRDGVLFVRGYEMSHGYMPWGLPDDAIFDCGADPLELGARIIEKGGVLFYAHSEEDRHWDSPYYTGMEIYNIHTDFKDESLGALLPDLFLSLDAYPDQSMRMLFDPQTPILQHWDELNQTRRVVGISANDAHQNTGFRGFYSADDEFVLRNTGTDVIGTYPLNFLTRFVLAMAFGPLKPDQQLFRFDLDPYERSLRFVNTHLLATEHTEEALIDALRNGRAFIAFDMIADARGFMFRAESPGGQCVMGEHLPYENGMVFHAASPLPVQFRLIRDGQAIAESEGRTFTYPAPGEGVYRMEAHVRLRGEWIPWVYTNPIYATETAPETPPYPGYFTTSSK